MLRKLFGSAPARPRGPGRAAPPASTRAEAPPQRRKPVLEALEGRLLLSADPLGAVVDPQGVLALQLTDGNDTALIERIGDAAGGNIVAVTVNSVTQQYGDAFFGIVRLLIDAGAGDDLLRLVGITVPTEIIGGLGTDTFEWQHGDATWSITALDTGRVETVAFTSFENLVGADNSADTFVFAPGASVSGTVDGGAGGLDSLVIQGDYQNVALSARSADAGVVALDDRAIAYTGIEPVTLDATAANLTLNATAGDDAVRLDEGPTAGQSRLDSLTGTLPDVTFANPTASITINLGAGDDRITIGTLDSAFAAALQVSGDDGRDRIDFAGTVGTHGQDIGAAAETIVVAPGSVLRTDRGAGGAAGDLVLTAVDASSHALGAADASVTVDGGTLIARNITLGATASFTVNAAFIDGGSSATVAIFGGGEVAATGMLTIDVRSSVSAILDLDAAPAAFAPDPAAAELRLSSVAAARIGDGAVLAATGDIEVDVLNAMAIDIGDAPAAVVGIAAGATVAVETGATLTGQDVSLSAATDATFVYAGVAAVPDFACATHAVIGGEAAVRAMGAVQLGATSLSRIEHVFAGEGAEPAGPMAVGLLGNGAGILAGALAAEALRPDLDREYAQEMDPGLSGAYEGAYHDLAPDLRLSAIGRLLADAAELATTPAGLLSGEAVEEAIARELAAIGVLFSEGGPNWGVAAPLAGMIVATNAVPGRPLTPLPAGDADGDARNRQRPADTGSEPDDGDAGLGASLALSVIKESAIAELARNVTSGGAVVLSASGTPFVRSRVRGGTVGEAGGALELGEGDLAGAVVVAEDETPAVPALVAGGNLVPGRSSPGEVVLATGARHDLVAEASGGAEPGTAVTAETPIDVLAVDAGAELAAGNTFTLVLVPEAADAPGTGPEVRHPAGGEVAGLALSMHLPALAFEDFAGGDRNGADAAIRSGDDVGALAGERAIVVSALLDRPAPAPAPSGAAIGDDVDELVRCLDGDAGDDAAGAAALIGYSRDVVIAYLAALAAPFATSTAPTRRPHRRAGARPGGDLRREVVPDASWYASRVAFGGRADAGRAGGAWVERFVNDLGLAPEDQNPNAKIKVKL